METKLCCTCKKILDINAFSFKNKNVGKRSSECRDCHKEFNKKWYSQNSEKIKENVKNRTDKNKEIYKEYKSKLFCKNCGENHPATLDFHHRDPKEKEFTVPFMIKNGYSWKRIFAEMEKCDVLCSNCHRKFHYENIVR